MLIWSSSGVTDGPPHFGSQRLNFFWGEEAGKKKPPAPEPPRAAMPRAAPPQATHQRRRQRQAAHERRDLPHQEAHVAVVAAHPARAVARTRLQCGAPEPIYRASYREASSDAMCRSVSLARTHSLSLFQPRLRPDSSRAYSHSSMSYLRAAVCVSTTASGGQS